MTTTTFTHRDLQRLSRDVADGEGKHLRWELQIVPLDRYGDLVRLVTYVRKPEGREYAIYTAL